MPSNDDRRLGRSRAGRKRFLGDASGNVALMFGVLGPFLIALGGGAIDLTRVMTAKSKLNDAADAAALAAVAQSSINSVAGGYTNTTALAANGRAMFMADIAGADANVSNVQVNVAVSSTLLTATVSYTGAVTTIFGGLVGLPSVTVKGVAKSSHGMPTYADFYLALDISQSMGLAATDADIAKLSSLTGGCAFACHVSQGTPQDNYTVARANGVQLRIDAVRDATAELITSAQTSASVANQYRVALYGFNAGTTTIQALTTNLPAAKTAASTITMAQPTSDGHGETNYTANIPQIASLIANPGNGTTASSPKKWLFIVTDGVQDVYDSAGPTYSNPGVSAAAWGHDTQPLTSSLCDAIKARGINIAVLYTTYLPMPTRIEWTTLVQPFATTVPNNLKACATPNFYWEAYDSVAIHAAMASMFAQAVSSAKLDH